MQTTYPSNGQNNSMTSHDAKAHGASCGVTGEFKNFLADVEDLFKSTTSLTGDDLARAKAKITARIDAAKESVEDMSASLAQQARRSATMTNNYVHEQPWTVIGVGAAVSFMLGFLLARRS